MKSKKTMSGTKQVDQAVQSLNVWLKELMKLMKWENRDNALISIRACLHALRDVLPLHESVHLGAQLPLILKGFYYDGWAAHDRPQERANTQLEFFDLVRKNLANNVHLFDVKEVQTFCRAIMQLLLTHTGEGLMRKIQAVLPQDTKGLIPLEFVMDEEGDDEDEDDESDLDDFDDESDGAQEYDPVRYIRTLN